MRQVLLIGPLLLQSLMQEVHINYIMTHHTKTEISPDKGVFVLFLFLFLFLFLGWGHTVTGLPQFSIYAVVNSIWMDSDGEKKVLLGLHENGNYIFKSHENFLSVTQVMKF